MRTECLILHGSALEGQDIHPLTAQMDLLLRHQPMGHSYALQDLTSRTGIRLSSAVISTSKWLKLASRSPKVSRNVFGASPGKSTDTAIGPIRLLAPPRSCLPGRLFDNPEQ